MSQYSAVIHLENEITNITDGEHLVAVCTNGIRQKLRFFILKSLYQIVMKFADCMFVSFVNES